MKGKPFSRRRSKPWHRLLRAATQAPSSDLSTHPSLENLAWSRDLLPFPPQFLWDCSYSYLQLHSLFWLPQTHITFTKHQHISSDAQFGIYLYTSVRFKISLTEKKSEEDEERVMKNARGFQPSH